MDKKTNTKSEEGQEEKQVIKSTMSQVNLTTTTAVINSGGILYLFYRFFKLEEACATAEKREKVIIKNTNTLNIQFKRWVSILAGEQLKTNDNIDELREAVMRQGDQIQNLEQIISDLKDTLGLETCNPMLN